ncbi:MAG TPA: peptide ABC transporter substrate-binding protein [Streptosporangiaceae bacterium]|nr:peptide ABC transporter substrate-binding protein [Streptosporangiaceae bacterium]
MGIFQRISGSAGIGRAARFGRAARLTVAMTATGLLAAACVTSPSSSGGNGPAPSGTPVSGGTATFAENPASGAADYIFPMVSLAYDTPTNVQFQFLQFRPLYWFGQGSSPSMNPQLSVAEPPVFSQGNTVVTIQLKHYLWSDGKPVTSRDVLFWINLLRANVASWALSLPGGFPANIKSAVAQGPSTVRLTLIHKFNPEWFTDTQLTQIIPIPQHAWDKTSASGKVGNFDESTSSAVAVYKFLDAQAKNISTYTSNPLWQVVDGPWKLSTFRSDGYAQFVPNPKYSGTKPRLKTFVMEPFTSEAAEFNVLRSGGLSYGYVPISDLSQESVLRSAGYRIVSWPSWSISYIVLNFNNPTVGPMLRQLYIRQAMQYLMDQHGYIKAFLKGNGVPTNGPAPAQPPSSFASPQLQHGFYSYDPAKAVQLLRSHGWAVHPNGTSTCAKPGTGAGQCGAGIKAGAALSFNLKYLSGVTYLDQEIRTFKSELLTAGIQLNLSEGSESQVVDTAAACKPGPSCSWEMVQWGSPSWIWSSAFPSGEAVFETGAGVNAGSYSSKTNDANILAVQTSSSSSAFFTYENYLAQQLPDLWLPNTYNQVSAIKSDLDGASQQSPLLLINPEAWAFTK